MNINRRKIRKENGTRRSRREGTKKKGIVKAYHEPWSRIIKRIVRAMEREQSQPRETAE